MLLNKNIDALVIACPPKPEKECRYDLQVVEIDEEGVGYVATATHMYVAKVGDSDTADFPSEDGEEFEAVKEFPFRVSATAIKQAIKNRPKKGLKVLTDNMVLECNVGEAKLHTYDLESFKSVTAHNKTTEYLNLRECAKKLDKGRDEEVCVGLFL